MLTLEHIFYAAFAVFADRTAMKSVMHFFNADVVKKLSLAIAWTCFELDDSRSIYSGSIVLLWRKYLLRK